MPPSAAISSLSKAYTIRWRAGCILDLNASEVMWSLKQQHQMSVGREIVLRYPT